jgi:hypothetical protein
MALVIENELPPNQEDSRLLLLLILLEDVMPEKKWVY